MESGIDAVELSSSAAGRRWNGACGARGARIVEAERAVASRRILEHPRVTLRVKRVAPHHAPIRQVGGKNLAKARWIGLKPRILHQVHGGQCRCRQPGSQPARPLTLARPNRILHVSWIPSWNIQTYRTLWLALVAR